MLHYFFAFGFQQQQQQRAKSKLVLSLEKEKATPLLYSILENSMDYTVHGVAELDTTEWRSLLGQSYNVLYFSKGMVWKFLPQ